MRSRTSPKIWLLMLIPVFVLLGIGWMQRDKRTTFTPPLPQSGPLQIVVTNAQFEELKPREVAEGFDTKLTLTLDLQGQLPKKGGPFQIFYTIKNLRLVDIGKLKPEKLQDGEDVVISDGVNYRRVSDGIPVSVSELPTKRSFYLALSKYKASTSALELRADINGDLSGQRLFMMGGVPSSTQVPLGKLVSSPFSLRVRETNQTVRVPPVSRFSSLQILKSEVAKLPPNHWRLSYGQNVPAYEVTTSFMLGTDTSSNDHSLLHLGRPYVIDDQGKIYRFFKWQNTQITYAPTVGREPSIQDLYDSKSPATAVWYFPAEEIPLSAGQLTFKTSISLNDEWPAPVSVVVRPRNFKPPTKPFPFRIQSQKVRAINEGDYDTEVEFRLQPTTPFVLKNDVSKQLIINYSQHVRIAHYARGIPSSAGIEVWNFSKYDATSSRGTYVPIQQEAHFDSLTKQYKVIYRLPMKFSEVPRGDVTFKTDIGMKGTKFLPLSVVVRP